MNIKNMANVYNGNNTTPKKLSFLFTLAFICIINCNFLFAQENVIVQKATIHEKSLLNSAKIGKTVRVTENTTLNNVNIKENINVDSLLVSPKDITNENTANKMIKQSDFVQYKQNIILQKADSTDYKYPITRQVIINDNQTSNTSLNQKQKKSSMDKSLQLNSMATVRLSAGDIWGDGTGYQLLIDADNAGWNDSYGPTCGSSYTNWEYKIPSNASANDANVVINATQEISIPAGTYSYLILNPGCNSYGFNYIASGQNDPSKASNFEFEAGKIYTFTITLRGPNDCVTISIEDGATTNKLCEDFENYNYVIPTNWYISYTGTSEGYFPHINAGFVNSSNGMYFMSGDYRYNGTTYDFGQYNYAILPQYSNLESISFNYRYESANNGILTLGYIEDNTFYALETIPGNENPNAYAAYSLYGRIPTDAQLAFCWYYFNRNQYMFYVCGIDNVCVTISPTLTYDATTNCNGTASNYPSSVTRETGSTIQISGMRPVCSSGNLFVGWATNADGTGTIYQPGDSYTLNSDVTLYAVYRQCANVTASISATGANSTSTESGHTYFNVCQDNEMTLKYNLSNTQNVSSCKWYINAHDGNAPYSESRNALWNLTFTPESETGHDVSLVVTKTDGCAYYASARIRVSNGLQTTHGVSNAGNICIGSGTEITVGAQADNSIIEVESIPVEITATLGQGDETFIPDGPNCPQGQCYESYVTFYDFDESTSISSVDDINYVRINMEHSFVGDVQIKITCPNGQSAIILQDYYSSDPNSSIYDNQAIDPDSYPWPTGITYSYYIGSSPTSLYRGASMLSSTRRYDANENLIYNHQNFYTATFATEEDALDFIDRFLNIHYPNEYNIYSYNNHYVIGYVSDNNTYYIWFTRNTTDDLYYAYSFSTQEAAQHFIDYNWNGNGNVYTHSSYNKLYFGEPEILDVIEMEYVTDVCDENDEFNISGAGYNYAWTSNSNYTTVGYVYDINNISDNSTIYFDGEEYTLEIKHVIPSDINNGTHIYQPFQSFSNLVGCPLNGTWTISVCDSWGYDNGYIFNWDLSLNGIIPNSWNYEISLDDIEVQTNNIVTESSTPNVFNIHPTEDNASTIVGQQQTGYLTLIDNIGCETTEEAFTYTVTEPVKPAVINETICLGASTTLSASNTAGSTATPFTYAWSNPGSSLSATNTQTVTASPTWSTTYSLTITDNNGCSGSTTPTVTVNAPTEQQSSGDYYLWTGKGTNPTRWNEAGNWAVYSDANNRYQSASHAPTTSDDVYIVKNGTCTTNSPTINSDASARNLKIDNGMTLSGGSNNLNIGGNMYLYATNSFVPQTGTITFVGNSDQTIDKTMSFYNVVFNQSSTNTITAPSMNVANSATFTKGIIENDMTFASGATASGANQNSFVDGTVTKTGSSTSFTFPTGAITGTMNVLGTATIPVPSSKDVAVKFNSAAKRATVVDGVNHYGFNESDGYPRTWNPNDMCDDNGENEAFGSVSNYEYWSIVTPVNLSGVTLHSEANNMNAHFSSTPISGNGINELVKTALYTDCGWKNVGGSTNISADRKTIEISGISIPANSGLNAKSTRAAGDPITTFGSLIPPDAPLPIELVSFTAECNNSSANISWTTASERNNEYFVLERSHDAENFVEVARIAGAGNSLEPINYSYTDYNMLNGDNYYRLWQVDFDGTRNASEIISVNCKDDSYEAFGEPTVEAYPNPFHSEITLRLENFGNQPATIEIFDMLGKLIAFEKVDSPMNYYEMTLQLQNLAPATYNIRVTTDETVIVKKVVKK